MDIETRRHHLHTRILPESKRPLALQKHLVLLDCNNAFAHLLGFERYEIIGAITVGVISKKIRRLATDRPQAIEHAKLPCRGGGCIIADLVCKPARLEGEMVRVVTVYGTEKKAASG